jgi:hypothetical protein
MALLSAAMLARAESADEILRKSRATYAELKSYSDTGVVRVAYGTSSEDQHTFTTSFNRVPRHFLFEFRKQGGDRYIVWGDPEAFHTWWKTTDAQYDYPNPNNAAAISGSGQNTSGVVLKIPTLLYAKAPLGGDFNNFVDVALDGTEMVAGRSCYRLVGRVSDVYGATGKEVNVRRMTVWIDTDSSLIRQIREESKALPGQRSWTITTYQPKANPAIDAARFTFTRSDTK